AVAEGTVAAVLLIGGGLQALQTASIVTGLPFAFILLFMCYSLYIGLRDEHQQAEERKTQKEWESYEERLADIIKKRSSGKQSPNL
ncbi:choline transporter, partial [Flavobacterium sp. IR1]